MCDRTEWEYGESWITDAACPVLELSPAWCVSTDLDMRHAIPWMQFQVCSKSFVLRPGEGLPGRVWRSQQPEWLENVSAQSEAYFLRHQIAKALSVKAGFGMPVMVNSQVLAVVVFFMSKERSLDATLIEQTKAVVENFQHEYLTNVLI
ncbi:MAG: GAF domain-containing protein [Timaviella obliquedivisa GSE-PSE-MK23-08B]|nr:GAF domain-containing protein [Timaviella obliquedivisa GSE-PSE-MK23-08B]